MDHASKRRALRLVGLPLILVAAAPIDPPASIDDPRLREISFASVSWTTRSKRSRQVVDVVCLVSDMSGFLEAISSWDRDHAFPVLFDDDEYSLKFLRAFRPSRVVRLPAAAKAIPAESLWLAMETAVGRSWRPGGDGPSQQGDEVPAGMVPNVPGIVFSSATSPSLAGAAALAAGRFEPILRWEPGKTFDDRLSSEEADQLARDLQDRVEIRFPGHAQLGDDCDFITLAGNYPFAYEVSGGRAPGRYAFDDRVGFDALTRRRWAYTGRLIGDPAASVYRSMCSLFLATDSAALIDGYDDRAPVWSDYAMPAAERRLGPMFPVTRRSGPEDAGIDGWRRLFASGNPFGLLLINSSGIPDRFNLRVGEGGLADVPESVPCVVDNIHSFSASDPRSAETIAGRWLDGGAYVYFGSMNEPFLTSFRTPTLVADLIANGVPLSAAFRQACAGETLPVPWRLVYLGDPLCTITPAAARPLRVAWDAVAGWPSLELSARRDSDDDQRRLNWTRSDAVLMAARGESVGSSDELVSILLSIRRDRLSPAFRHRFDALLAACASDPKRVAAVRARLESIPAASRSRAVGRTLDHAAEAREKR